MPFYQLNTLIRLSIEKQTLSTCRDFRLSPRREHETAITVNEHMSGEPSLWNFIAAQPRRVSRADFRRDTRESSTRASILHGWSSLISKRTRSVTNPRLPLGGCRQYGPRIRGKRNRAVNFLLRIRTDAHGRNKGDLCLRDFAPRVIEDEIKGVAVFRFALAYLDAARSNDAPLMSVLLPDEHQPWIH